MNMNSRKCRHNSGSRPGFLSPIRNVPCSSISPTDSTCLFMIHIFFKASSTYTINIRTATISNAVEKQSRTEKTTSSWNTMCMKHRYVNIIKNQRKKHQETHIISIYIKSFISLTLLRPFHEKKPHTKTADSHSIVCKTKHSWTVSVILLYALANIKHGLNTSPSFQQHQVIVFDSI